MKRSIIVKICAVLVLLAIAATMFVIGRGHTVYFDNKTFEQEGESLSAFQKVEVYVNGERVAKLAKRERGVATWIGQNFEMEVVITVNKGDEPQTIEYAIKLPYSMDGVVVNLPALYAGYAPEIYISEFVSLATTTTEDDEEVDLSEDMGLGDI